MSSAVGAWRAERIDEPGKALIVPFWTMVCASLVAVALGLRLGALDKVPLAPDEAARALEALTIWRGDADGYSGSPVLLNLLTLWCALFTFADGPARVPNALAGLALTFTPLLFAPWLGRGQSLLACGLLAISPLGVLASRSVHPASLALLAVAVGVAAVLEAYRRGEGRWLVVAAIGIALGLGSTPAFVGQALVVGLAAAVCPPMAKGMAPDWRRWAPRAVLIGLATALIANTLLLSRPSGLQSGLINPLAGWIGTVGLNRNTPLSAGLGWSHEILLLAAAAWSLPIALRDSFGRFLAIWSAASLSLVLLQRSGDLTAFVAPTYPLALLGGYGLTRYEWLKRSREPKAWVTGLALLVPLLFLVFAVNMSVNRNAAVSFSHVAVALGGIVASLLLASAWLETSDLRVALGVAVVVGLLVLGVTFLTRLNFSGHERGGPFLLSASSRPEIREIELRARDWWRQEPAQPIRVDRSLRPLLAWSLRDGPDVEWIAAPPTSGERVILGGETSDGRPAGQWQRLTIAERYFPPDGPQNRSDLWRWLVLRQSFLETESHAILVLP